MDGARTPPNKSGIAPCRSTSMSSMLSAPAAIPATRQRHLQLRRSPRSGWRSVTCSPTRPARPQRSRQRHHRDQARPRHEIRVIKRCVRLRRIMQQSHLRGVLSAGSMEASATPIVPAQRAPFASTRPNTPLFTRWIEAKQRVIQPPRFRSSVVHALPQAVVGLPPKSLVRLAVLLAVAASRPPVVSRPGRSRGRFASLDVTAMARGRQPPGWREGRETADQSPVL